MFKRFFLSALGLAIVALPAQAQVSFVADGTGFPELDFGTRGFTCDFRVDLRRFSERNSQRTAISDDCTDGGRMFSGTAGDFSGIEDFGLALDIGATGDVSFTATGLGGGSAIVDNVFMPGAADGPINAFYVFQRTENSGGSFLDAYGEVYAAPGGGKFWQYFTSADDLRGALYEADFDIADITGTVDEAPSLRIYAGSARTVSVPEPTSAALLLTGLLGFAGVAYRRRES